MVVVTLLDFYEYLSVNYGMTPYIPREHKVTSELYNSIGTHTIQFGHITMVTR